MFLIKLVRIMEMTVKEMLNKFSNSQTHSFEVKRIAGMIFDEANKKLLEMSSDEKKLLEAAALLHDIGYSVEEKSHNKHSMHLIIENGLREFTEPETRLIACIARYHRGSLPNKVEHEIYNKFEKRERKIVKRLGGILKLADGLDKEHRELIKNIKIDYDYKNKIAKIILYTDFEKPDISAAIRKRDLFEVGFKCQSVILFE